MAEHQVSLDINELTTRQVLNYLVKLTLDSKSRLREVEKRMSALTEAVAALQGAVDNVAVRQNAHITDLQSKLSDALALVQELSADDAADEAALDAAKQQIADLLEEAASAADTIKGQVDELNGLGAEPSTPVEEVPVEELPEPVPAPEIPTEDDGDDAPVVDDTPAPEDETPVDGGSDAGDPTTPAVDDAPATDEPAVDENSDPVIDEARDQNI